MPKVFGNKSQLNPQVEKKTLQNWENTGLFLVGKQPVFGCKIGKIKSGYARPIPLWAFVTLL